MPHGASINDWCESAVWGAPGGAPGRDTRRGTTMFTVCLLAGMVVAAPTGRAMGRHLLGGSVFAGQTEQEHRLGSSSREEVAGRRMSAADGNTFHLLGGPEVPDSGSSSTTSRQSVVEESSPEPEAVVELWLPRVIRGQTSGTGEPSTPGPTPTSRGGPVRPTDVPAPTPYGDVYAGCQVIEREVVASDGKETVIVTRSVHYNAFSMPVRESVQRIDGSYGTIAQWTYDRDLPVLALFDSPHDGQWDNLSAWEYREDGQVSLYEVYDLPNRTEPAMRYAYDYDDMNRRSRWSVFYQGVEGFGLRSMYIYRYDDDGRLDERLHLSSDGATVTIRERYSWAGDVMTGLVYDTDDDGIVDYNDYTVDLVYDGSRRLIRSTQRTPATVPDVPVVHSYWYNEYGWLVRHEIFNGHLEGTVSYAYDSAGRLLIADVAAVAGGFERRYRSICPKQ